MHRIERLPLHEALSSVQLKTAIEEITAQSYANPAVLLEQEFKKNNTAYFSFGSEGDVQAFFLVGWSRIPVTDGEQDCVFLGLSAVRSDLKGRSFAISLYRAFFRDAKQYSVETKAVVMWWFHTASPIVAGVMWHIAPNIGPTEAGRLSERQGLLLSALVEKFGFTKFQEPDLPFVLRGVAKARYSGPETIRLSTRELRQNSSLSTWDIQESAGDRVLFVGFLDSDQ